MCNSISVSTNRLLHLERAACVLVVVATLFLGASPSAAQRESERYEGRGLAEALRVLQARGLRIIFSSATVTPDMRVVAEPRAHVARQILDELLEPHGLKAEEGPGGVIQVVRARLAAAVQSRKPVTDTRAGAIQGKVLDASTGSPMPGVLVQTMGGWQEARTNEEGRFQLSGIRAGIQTLDISMPGYALMRRTLRVVAGKVLDVAVYLSHGSGIYSERVTVSAPLRGRQDPGIGSEVSIENGELQSLRGGLADDPMRAVQMLPRVATGDDFRSEFSVRGSPYRHINVVVDGVATPWLQHALYGGSATGSVSMLSTDLLERASLYAGAYPHRYGDRIGAELELTLRQGSRTARQLHGAISGTNTTLVAEGPIGRSERGSWIFALRNSYRDWPLRRLRESSPTAFSYADAQAKLVYDVRPSQQVSFTFLGGRSRVDERGDRGTNELADGTNRAAVLNLGWRSTLGSRVVLSQRAHLVSHEFLNRNQTGQIRSQGADGEFSYRIDLASTVFGGLLEAGGQAQKMQGSQRQLGYGEPFAGALPQIGSVDGFEGKSWVRSGYVNFNWNVTPRLTIAPGLRVANSTLVRSWTATRWLLGQWSFGPDWTLNASAGVSHQSPEFEQVLGRFGAPALRPERATHFDIGIEQRLAKSVRWQATFFERHERDILHEPGFNPTLMGETSKPPHSDRYENALRGSSHGLELLLERRSTTGLSGWVAYSYGRTRYIDATRKEWFWADFDQRHAINVSSVYRLSERTNFVVKFRGGTNFPIPGYVDARDGGLFAGLERNQVRLPNYSRLDIRASRSFNYYGHRLTLFFEVVNALNRTNRGPAGGFIVPRPGEAVRFTEPLLPRCPLTGLLIEF